MSNSTYNDTKNHGENIEITIVGNTSFSMYSDDYSAEHISITHYDNGNVNVAFILNGEYITNNALGILTIFKTIKNPHKHFYLTIKEFEQRFKMI